MDNLIIAFTLVNQFNKHGQGLIILYAISKALNIGASFQGVPKGVVAETWNKTTETLDLLTPVEQLAFAKSLIDEFGAEMTKVNSLKNNNDKN